jgi:hypothetical protein
VQLDIRYPELGYRAVVLGDRPRRKVELLDVAAQGTRGHAVNPSSDASSFKICGVKPPTAATKR